MWEIVTAGGWLMVPIVASSVIALAIIGERFFSLRNDKVLPVNLVADVWRMASTRQLTEDKIREIQQASPLGRVLAAGLHNRSHDREVMKASIEEVGGHVAHELERYLNALGTIAAVTPLLGLLGTVIGMISVFTNITTVGVGNPAQLAGGISQALITTAGGLMVAIPALMFHRYFRRKVDGLVVDMEKESLKLVDVLQKRQSQARVAQG
ncbi:MotA/TolQ/ExbB proton channel family protein [Granulosicoccus antarcticus]|uniref:Biopolymer transport protein ExbB n=1 Tax=Granulosicoccus antarcticus IMCC3135 TaxID=1192854 RepID=A0A2Z2P1B8_9GAMM|nr:MotA/TolQ/ExbB proton channel family protein [Granulosicoccus antarcticus]ASJ75010.1 Biopolymer transport protein ExbB [Granulosicoccus antarcticus IMCC3135]